MTRLQVRIRYYTDGFWIHPDLLGWQTSFERDGGTVEIELPTLQTDFSAGEHEAELQAGPAFLPVATVTEPDWDHRTVAVHLFVVRVTFDAELAEEYSKIGDNVGYDRMAADAGSYGQELADQAAFDFLRWLRARSRQEWLGLVAEHPRQYGRAGLYYESGEGIMGFGPRWSQTFRSSRLRFEEDGLDYIGHRLANGDEIPVSDELLSDAWHLFRGAEVPDLQRAVITAASACEVRSEEVMRKQVDATRAALLRLLLKKSSTLRFILHEVALAAFDISLKDSNPDLYKRVDALAFQRNRVVHEGMPYDGSSLQGGPALVAEQLYGWLDATLVRSKDGLPAVERRM